MNRLDTELHRLYLPQPIAPQQAEPAQDASPALIGADGQVRALVLELASAAGWEAVAALWQGLQNELELPAPAIAISGAGYQVWISLVQPVSVAQARGFLESLCRRFLAGIAPRHVQMQPSLEADAPEASDAAGSARHARLIPAQLDESGHWSAFISPHLAAMFADEPWLDMKPSPDAQADLLLRLKSLSPADWRRAQLQLEPAEAASTFAAASSSLPAAMPDPAAAAGNRPDVENSPDAQASATTGHQGPRAASVAEQDPRRFLLAVMNDPTAELRWRIEAAKALLPYSTR
ncbi:hypothetical protein C6P61_12970 [Malikia spinosa]|uniref:Uncharacterized protein n=1 Tax=Malikia spinosa TaxID=86180 RepID=A0A2S9KCA4_9BURK|nr:hypothetical protein [Malikia spinosa]PRD68083.1 hypothetical protein C6P61_12970 [Malikia spinosa]